MNRKRDKDKKKSNDEKLYGIIFLAVVIFLYIIISLLNPEDAWKSIEASGNLLIQIIPILLLIILFMGLINYFINPKTISKYVGKGSGIKGWALAISTGILSHGPIYVWYPLLKDLREQGMRNGLIAVFLYNRAIKIPLLPLMVYYFGILYVVLLMIYMIIASIVEGKVIEIVDGEP